MNTAAINENNRRTAEFANNLSKTAVDHIYQRERDIMAYAFAGSESAADRALKIYLTKLDAKQKQKLEEDVARGKLFGVILNNILGSWGSGG